MGLPVSGGLALARVFLVRDDSLGAVPHYTISEEEVPREIERLRCAMNQVARALEHVIEDVTGRLGEAQAEIFVAQRMMVEDALLLEQMCRTVASDYVNAETALEKTLDEYERLLRNVEDEYMRERSSDVADVRRRLMHALTRGNPARDVVLVDNTFRMGERRIIVAEELTPGLTVALDAAHTVGFITSRGGRASHSAILARALGIPAVTAIEGIHETVGHGETVLMNGDTGEVIVWPGERTLDLCLTLNQESPAGPNVLEPLQSVCVMANINLAADAEVAAGMRAEGVGLYRTEYEFLAAGRVLSEEEQLDRYARVLEIMDGSPVYFRLLDLGGDKAADFLDLPKEDNPALGFRGARFLQARTDLLLPQVRALARLSVTRPVHIMYPMITEFEQFVRLRTLIEQHVAGISGACLLHGVMFEVPSACLDADRIYEEAAFGSIGSNDLTQYLFAVDRNNQHVAYDFQQDRPVFWKMVRMVGDAARRQRKPLSLCGEMAGQAEYLPRLLDAGVDSVSVSPRLVPLVRMTALRLSMT